MAKKLTLCSLMAVFLSIILVSGCKSTPKVEPLPDLKADAEHALVYFLRSSVGNTIGIWNGETPIGIIQDSEYIIHQAVAGTSYFIIDAAGVWRSIKAELGAGKTYYVTFSTVNAFNMYYVAVDVKNPEDQDVQQRLKEDKRVGFDDNWKKEYSNGRVDIVREELKKAKSGSSELLEIASSKGK